MTYEILDTSMPANWSENLMYSLAWDIRPEFVTKVIECIFLVSSEVLSDSKSKTQPVALVYRKVNKEVVAAAICQFFPNEDDPTKPGNWSLVWTFEESDIPENANIIEASSSHVCVYFKAVAGAKFNIEYDAPDVINVLNVETLAAIKKWLDENAKEKEEVILNQESVFQARVAVEGGAKVFAIEPAGEIKMLIKDDASIEK